ncbi:Beige/BEACH domain containing protein [Trichomonas vaginalis G3]|uniref:Beige/BEACH domain containing protein n=1 Tax=Trichomonas vaginalis (strain ATCC PRA-98 / G3) TaxID=412133 RepID=A2DG76_TRIV3|nr:beige/BEACH-related family [Trichomonas vaginalis G3]EAY20703.1 Beige/BEACH domain containing protein [Trichomonas vaginalis G3]KAI5487423.1 beige/BEACH-related family [Trichomonas vaginalis G3]|eukprot:XP_001581689.1 Beige/BEACH domain containing protein [Trichomonas vaginalis G3]
MTTISSCTDDQQISTLSEDNFQKIPKSESEKLFFIPMRWNFFEKYFELNPSDTCFSAIFLNAFFHPDEIVRKYARETFTKTLRRCKVNIIPPLNPINLLLDELLENKAEIVEDTLIDISLVMATKKDIAKVDYFELLYSLINENNYITYMSVSYILFASNTEIYKHFFLLWLSTQKYFKEKDEIQYQNMISYFTDRSVLCGISKHSQVYKIFAEFWNKYDFTPEKIASTLDILLESQPSSNFTPLFTILGKEKCRLILCKLNTEYYELAFFCSFLTYDEFSDPQIALLTIDILVRTINSRPDYYIMFGTTKIHPFIVFSNIAGQIISTKPSKKDDMDQLYKSLATIVPIDAHINYSKIVYNKYQPDLFKINFDYNNFLKDLLDMHKTMVDNERKSFNKIHDDFDQDIKNDKLRTSKLFTSFMRTISTDGGPWSSELCKCWKYMAKVDSTGRILFYSRNTHFTDHKNARNKKGDNDEEIEPIKSFVLSFKKEIRKSISVFQATSRKITGFYNGYLHILDDSICFDGVYSADSFGNTRLLEKKRPFFKLIQYSDITFIFRRYFLHEDCGIEVFTKNFKSYLFYFVNFDTRNNFLATVSTKIPKVTLPKDHLFSQLVSKFGGIPIQNCEAEELLWKSGLAKRWSSGRLSNYEYLYLLNVIGGRSFNNVSQYPIYPWIIADYKTNKFDISNPSFFRDLSKMIGALNQERYDTLRNDRDLIDDPTEKSLFRSNMSNPSSVCGFLVREEPFTTMHIKLQDGYFDKADRLFYSIESAWNSCNNSASDYRELLPQFYCNSRFLKNENKFSFGTRSTGVTIDDVELPNWASSPYDFVDKNLIALESSYTSQHLNEWIDLVFGVNQRIPESEFHCFSYHDCMIGLTNEEDIELRKNYCANFGSMPTKIFRVKSPKKNIQIPLKVFDYQSNTNSNGNTAPPPKILCLLNGCCLTEDGVFTKLSRKMHKVKFNYRFTDDMLYAVSTNPLTLFVCGKNSPVVTSFPFNHPNNPTRLMHSSSNLICMSATSDRLVVCGSDCFIYLWNSMTSELISTMQIHSYPIVDVSASTELAAFASIDRSHNIFVVSLTDKHVISPFNAKVSEDVKNHKICLTQNGRIIISNRSDSKENSILIFDICGSLINKLAYGCEVVAIRSAMLSSGNVFCIASLGSRRIECISDKTNGIERMPNEDSKKVNESFNPNFVSIRSKEKTIWYGTNSGLLSRIVLCNDV